MKLHQLSIFLENRPGHLAGPCGVLADAGINILALTLAETERFGILRLLVRDWQRALDLLEAAGWVVKATEVVAVEVEDQPGGVHRLLVEVDRAGVNIDSLYAFTTRSGGKAVLVIRFDDMDRGLAALASAGLRMVGGDGLAAWGG